MTNVTAASIEHGGSGPIADLARLGAPHCYERNTLLVREGDAGHELFIVLDGRIRIFTESQNEHRFVIGTYGSGTLFGEGSLDGGPRTASVETVSEVKCAVVQYADLKAHMLDNPAFAMALLTELITRSRATTRRMKSLALDSVYQRLRTLFEVESIDQGGVRILGPDWTQQEVANRLGSSRDMVTKIFRELAKGGHIEVARGRTTLLKPLPKAW